MSSLFSELKRRNVFRVAAAYVIVAWLLAQVADLALENFGAPDWVMKTILLLLILGLPVAVLFAWAFELTPEGIKREKDVDRGESITATTGQRLNYAIVGLLVVALAYFVYESRFSDRGVQPVSPPAVAMHGARSIAVLPFATFGNEADSYLSDGLAETLLNLLAQIDDLQVAARTSAFKFKDTNEDIRVIGEQLGVATVLEGSVQRSGNRIRITAQLISVDDGFHMYSETFERELDDIFAIQDEIANAVVDALQLELLGTAAHSNPGFDAYESLARLRSRLRTSVGDDMIEVISALEELIREYPDYADGYATLSSAYTLHGQGAGLIPEETAVKAIAAGRKAIALAPDDAVGYVALAQALRGRGMLRQAAPVVARALELQPGNAEMLAAQGALLAANGRYQEAFDITSQALLRDPLNADTRSSLAERHRDIGQPEKAFAVLDAGVDIDPADITLQMFRAITFEETGRFRESLQALDQILQADASIPNAHQHRFYIFFNAGDMDTAKEVLERGEEVSVERLADERALYCYVQGDTECWHAATALMLATRDRFFVQNWQARMLYEGGLVDEAIAAMLPVVEYFDETDDPYGNLETRANLAALYQMNGQVDLAAKAMQPVIDAFDTALANGYDHHELYRYRAAVAVVAGDNDEAMRLLEEAYARGFRHVADALYLYAFDQMREDPRYRQLIDKFYSDNAASIASAITP